PAGVVSSGRSSSSLSWSVFFALIGLPSTLQRSVRAEQWRAVAILEEELQATHGIGSRYSPNALVASVNRATPRQSLGFAFVGNARLNERVIARLSTFHRLPLGLLTDSIHRARFPVDRHSVDDPQQGFLVRPHQPPSSPQQSAS